MHKIVWLDLYHVRIGTRMIIIGRLRTALLAEELLSAQRSLGVAVLASVEPLRSFIICDIEEFTDSIQGMIQGRVTSHHAVDISSAAFPEPSICLTSVKRSEAATAWSVTQSIVLGNNWMAKCNWSWRKFLRQCER